MGVFVGIMPYFWRDNLDKYYYGTARLYMRLVCTKMLSSVIRLDHQGNVYHCGAIRKSFGNLLETPLDEIWNSEEYRDFRKKMTENNLLPICARCCKVYGWVK